MFQHAKALILFVILAALSACSSVPKKTLVGPVEPVARSAAYNPANLRPYEVRGVTYRPKVPDKGDTQEGLASWYGPGFHSGRTANGEPYDMNGFSAAHKTLPLPSVAEITNLENGRTIRVRINDRGPFVSGRIIDLSKGAAQTLGVTGLSKIKLKFLGPAEPRTGRRADGDASPPVLSTVDPVPAAGDEDTLFRVQIGAFKVWENATRAQAALQGAQLEPGDQVFLVYLGPVKGAAAAEYERQRAVAAGFNDALIRKAPFVGN
jgi:rare lipoprotein A